MFDQHKSAPQTVQFGVHLMIDGYVADGAPMTDKAALQNILKTLPRDIGMHPICDPVVVEVGANCMKDPGGLSGFVMIAESHISFHTFPARGFVTIDLYTCQNDLDHDSVVTQLKCAFRIREADVYLQHRGIRYPRDDIAHNTVAPTTTALA